MNASLLPSVTRTDDQEPVRKARDTTTRRTRTWRRAIGLSAAGLAAALALRRRRRGKAGRSDSANAAGGTTEEGKAVTIDEPDVGTTDEVRVETSGDGGGRSLGRRLAALAVSAVAMTVARRLVRRATSGDR